MDKNLQELKYDLEREIDEEKSIELIETFIRVRRSKDSLEKYGTDPKYRNDPKSLLPKEKIDDLNKVFNEPLVNLLCENKKSKPTHSDLLKKWVKINEAKITRLEEPQDYNERNREALNGLYGEGKFGYKKYSIGHDKTYTFEELQKLSDDTIKGIKSPGVPVRDILECGTPPISIADARSVLRDAFKDDPDFKHSYMANIRMFLNDRDYFLHTDEIINDLIDFIFAE